MPLVGGAGKGAYVLTFVLKADSFDTVPCVSGALAGLP